MSVELSPDSTTASLEPEKKSDEEIREVCKKMAMTGAEDRQIIMRMRKWGNKGNLLPPRCRHLTHPRQSHPSIRLTSWNSLRQLVDPIGVNYYVHGNHPHLQG